MDQEKIGKFIATCRKEQSLTQADVAERLGITNRAVSKWETGKSMPDISILLQLCDLLDINVNELLTGERIKMEDYKKNAEKNLAEMANREKAANKKAFVTAIICGVMSVVAATAIIFTVTYAEIGNVWKAVLIIIGVVLMLIGIVGLLVAERNIGYYKCSNCGHTYVPSGIKFNLAFNMGMKKYMKCPYCGKRGFHKKVYSE